MGTIFSGVAATFITVPIAAYILLFIAAKVLTKNHRRSVRLSMDISTIFFILSVYYLIHAIWGHFLIWVILLVMIAIAATVVIVHYKIKQEIDIRRVLKGFWRLNFAFFLCAYFVLLFIGMVWRLTNVLTV
ncbi:DUF3397 domain-containing protein [Peribacillus sp. SCS-155]|uniref:DUF3397 domain-containing protein n=1 Tax=Peribacillus sedimenti TaxID=3115297 RepID=UPI003906B6F4